MTSAESIPGVLARRPQRADARRNYEKLIAVARDTFATDGVSASLEEIARKAGVGIGTLYRHFPTRQDLFESVYAADVEEVCRSGEEVADLPPWDALATGLLRFVDYLGTKRALAEAVNFQTEFFRSGRESVMEVGEKLLLRAQEAGTARAEVTFDDVLRLIYGLTMVEFVQPGQRQRVLGMALDGIRRQPLNP
jgi:AcrR family transcriptional regulator